MSFLSSANRGVEDDYFASEERLQVRGRRPRRSTLASIAAGVLLIYGAGCLAAQIPAAEDHAARAAQLVRAGDLRGAEGEMRKAAEISPKEPLYLARLGVILGMQHRPEEATACFENALRLAPGNLAIRRSLATSQWQMGRIIAAQENLELALKAEPGDAQTLLLLAWSISVASIMPQPLPLPNAQPRLCRPPTRHIP